MFYYIILDDALEYYYLLKYNTYLGNLHVTNLAKFLYLFINHYISLNLVCGLKVKHY